ncbi:hypothetical protein Tco_0066824 [Tanacetum coccineum]
MAQLKYCDKHNQVGFLRKPDESAGFAEIVDFLRGSNLRYALTANPTIYDSLVKQFWQSAIANTKADGSLEINATIDTIRYTISEASIRDSLQLDDATGITMLPNADLFEGMGQIGYPTDGTFTFWKSFFTPQWRYLVHHLLHCISSKSGGWDQFGSNIATALICLSTGRVYNFSKLIFDGMVANLKSKTKFLMYPRFLQMILNIQTENKHLYLAVSLTKKIFGNMKRGFRGAPRPLLPSMLLVATNPTAGQEHAAVAQSQPSSSTPIPTPTPPPIPTPTPPPIPTPTPPPIPTPTPPPIPTPTPPPIPTPTPPPIPTPTPPPIPTPPPPSPTPETEPTLNEHIFEEQSPVHHHFSPPQEQAPSQMPMDDLLHEVPKLISRIDSLEMDLKQTKLTMGNAIVKLVKKVKKLEGFLKRRNLVLTDSEEEEPEAQGRKTAKTLSKVASLKSRSIDKGRRYKRRKETKGKKVVSSLDFQEEVDAGAEQVNTASAEQVNTASAEQVNTASGVNTGSNNIVTGDEQLSTGDEQDKYILEKIGEELTDKDSKKTEKIKIMKQKDYETQQRNREREENRCKGKECIQVLIKNDLKIQMECSEQRESATEELLAQIPIWSELGHKKIRYSTMLKMKLLDGKMNEDCYRLLKMMEKQAGIKKVVKFVMAISVISFLSDSSEDKTPIIAPTIPPSPDYTTVSPDYSSTSDTESDPSEDPSSDHIPPLPAILPFLSSADDTTDIDTPDTPPSPTHGTTFIKITSSTQRSPIIPRRRVMILAPRQPIPHGRPYRYHLNGPVHMMTARKRVGPLPVQQLAVRHSVDHSSSDYFSPDDSARDSSSNSSSEASSDFHSDTSSDSSLRHSLPDHSSPDLPSTSVPSRKRRRYPMTSVPALPPISGALSPVRADLIPSPKKVRDFGYLSDVEVDPRETSLRDDVIAEISEYFAYADALRDIGIYARVIVEAVDREESETGIRGPIDVKVDRVIEGVQKEQGHRIVGLESAVTAMTERITELERDNKRLRGIVSVESQRFDRLQHGMSRMQRELRQILKGFDFMIEKMPNTRSGASMTHEEVEELVTRRVAEEMEAREAAMNLEPLNENGDEQEGGNRGNGNGGNRGNGNGGNKGNGNGGNGGNGNRGNGENGNGNRNGNHGMNYGGFMPVARECTFQDFLKCKPHNFSGTEGVVGLTRWFEKMEIVFNISNFPPKY